MQGLFLSSTRENKGISACERELSAWSGGHNIFLRFQNATNQLGADNTLFFFIVFSKIAWRHMIMFPKQAAIIINAFKATC